MNRFFQLLNKNCPFSPQLCVINRSYLPLTDDNFATIVNAVKQGRIIYGNIRKFAFFLIRCNFDELVVIASFAIAGLPVPLSAAMILWINLVTDGGPATALSMDTPTEDVM